MNINLRQKARSGSDGTPHRASSRPQRPRAPRAFTLVELLVVIGIIGLLAALLTPVVMQSLTKARNAAIKAEIDMLHMAIMNYKNEYGSFPPCFSAAIATTPPQPAIAHLTRVFPRMPAAAVVLQVRSLRYLNSGAGGFPIVDARGAIRPESAIVQWLYGFTDDPTAPVLSTNGSASISGNSISVTGNVTPRKKLFDFDMGRISNHQYAPSGKPNAPYLYYNSAAYSSGVVNPYDVVDSPNIPGPMRQTYAGDTTPFTNFGAETNEFFNTDSFQILCAGRDEIFGTDDDLSNFWPGTRREYLDGLKD
jgi:prepilin-type N-terminal cleavage/methylation domain-containing protein